LDVIPEHLTHFPLDDKFTAAPSPHLGEVEAAQVYETAAGFFTLPGMPPPPASLPDVRRAPDESWTNAPELAGFCQIMDQDDSNLVAIQRGLRATKKTGVHFGEYQESRIRDFHALLEST
jgi:hypothetical protein